MSQQINLFMKISEIMPISPSNDIRTCTNTRSKIPKLSGVNRPKSV